MLKSELNLRGKNSHQSSYSWLFRKRGEVENTPPFDMVLEEQRDLSEVNSPMSVERTGALL